MYYKSLFNINFHHGYFLDKGNEKYLSVDNSDIEMSNEDKVAALKEYDISEYLSIIPTFATQRIFKNYKMVFKKNTKGFRVLINTIAEQPIIPLEEDLTLTFAIQSIDPYFKNYTNLSSLSENEMYLFTNVVPVNQVDFENIFENNGGPIGAKFSLDAIATRNLLKDIAAEDASFSTINDQFSLSRAIQLIKEKTSITTLEKEAEIIELLNKAIQRRKQQRIVGYIRLRIRGDDNKYLFEFGAIDNIPEFTFSFVNRKSKWRYFSAAENKTFVTKEEKWLSKNGFTEITGKPPDNNTPSDLIPQPDKEYRFPNPTIENITIQNNVSYSDIFI